MAYSLHGNDDDDDEVEEMNEEDRDSDSDDGDDLDIDQNVSNEEDGSENEQDGDDGDDQDSNEEDEDDHNDEDDEAEDDDNSSRSSASSSASSPVKTSKIRIPKSSSWGNLAMNVKMTMNRNPNAKHPNSALPGGGVGGNIKRSTSPVPPSRRPLLPTARNKKILMEASASGGSLAEHASHMGESSSTGNSPAGKSSSAGTKEKPKFRIKLRVGHNNTSSEDLTGMDKAKAKGNSMKKKGKMMLPIQSTKRDHSNEAPSDRDEEEEAEFDDDDDDDDDVPMAIPVEENDATALVTANEKLGSNDITNDNNNGDSSDDDHAPLTSFKTKKKVSTKDGEKKTKKKKKKKKKPSGSGDASDDNTKKKKKKKKPSSSSSSTIPDSKKSTSNTTNDGDSKPSSKLTTNKPSTSSTIKPSSKPATAAPSSNSNHINNKSKSKSPHQTFGHHQNHHHHHHHIKSKSINANFRGVAAAHRNKQIHIPPMGSPGLLLVPNGALLSVFPVDADDNADAGAADATLPEGKEKGTVNVKKEEDGDATATASKSIKPVLERDLSSNEPKIAALKKESSATEISSKSNSDKSNSSSNTSSSALSATDNNKITKDKDKDKDNDNDKDNNKENPPNPHAKYLYKNQYLLPRTVFSHAMIAGGYTLEKRKTEPHRGSSTERTVHDMFDSDAGGMYLHFPELIPEVFWERRLDFRDEEAKVDRDGGDEKKDEAADGGGNAMDNSGSGETSGSKNGVNEKEENKLETESKLKIEARKSGDNEAGMKSADTPNVNNEECEESMSQKLTQVVKNDANSDALESDMKPNSDSILPVSLANKEAKNDGNLDKLSTDPASDDVEMKERVHSNDEMEDDAQGFEPAQKVSDAALKAPSEALESIKCDNNEVGSDDHSTLKILQAEQSTTIKVKEDTDITEVIPDAGSVIKTEDSDTNSSPARRNDQTNVAEGSSDAMDIAKGESAVAETTTIDVNVKEEDNETHICSAEATKEKANALTSKDDIEAKTSPPTASQKGLESNKNSQEETLAEAPPNEQHTTKGARLVDMVILGLSKIVRDRSNLEEQDCDLPCSTKAESSCHNGSNISTSQSTSEQAPQSISTALTLDDIPKLLPSYPPKTKKRRRPHEPMSFLDMIPISLTATYPPDYVAKRRDYAKAVQARELAIIESQETADDAADALEKYQAHTDAWERMLQYQKDQIAKRVEERFKTKEAKKAEKEAAAAAKAVEGEGRNERNEENGDEKETMEKSDYGDENDDISCEDVMEDPMDYMPPRPEPPSPARVITVPDIPIPPSPPTVVEIDENSDDGVMNDDMLSSQSGATTAAMRVPKLKSKLLQHLDPSCFLPTLEGRYFGLLSNGIADPQFIGTNAPGLRGITSGGGTGLATSYVGGGRGGAAGLVTGPTARAVSALQMHTSFSSSTSMAKIVAPKLKEEPPNTTSSAPADPDVEKPAAKKEKTTTKLEGKKSNKKDSCDAKTTSSESKKKSSDSTKISLSSKKSKRPSAAEDVSDSAKKKRRRTTPLTTGERNTTATEIGSGPAGHEFPDGWTVKTYRRAGGETIGKTDRFWFSPGLNIRFRAKKHARAFVDILKEPNVNGDEELAANVYRARGHHF